jgi:hypothetical protein
MASPEERQCAPQHRDEHVHGRLGGEHVSPPGDADGGRHFDRRVSIPGLSAPCCSWGSSPEGGTGSAAARPASGDASPEARLRARRGPHTAAGSGGGGQERRAAASAAQERRARGRSGPCSGAGGACHRRGQRRVPRYRFRPPPSPSHPPTWFRVQGSGFRVQGSGFRV